MASELAKRIYQLEWGQIDVIDAELREVRTVLLLTSRRRDAQGQPCWCVVMMRTMPHVEACQRARDLWAKLALPDPPEVKN